MPEAAPVPGVPVPAAPVPLPIPVTGSSPGSAPRSRTSMWILIGVAAALLALGVTAATGFLYSVVTRGGVGESVALGAELGKRITTEYPGYLLTTASSQLATDAGVAYVQRRFFVTLRDPRVKGFSMRVVYTAPDTSNDAADYTNSDTFFTSAATTDQPVGSFERMWVKAHPDTTCLYVQELDTSSESTRTFAVGYTRNGREFRAVDVYLAYGVADDAWRSISEVDAFLGTGGTGGMPADPSEAGTEALIAGAFPGFEEYRPYRTDTGAWESVIRSTAHPGVLLTVDPDMLPYYDDSDADKVLLGSPSKRGEAFMRAWESRHKGAIITWMALDPDTDGSSQLLEVSYSSFQKDSPFMGESHTARLEYHPSKGTWSWEKVPEY